MLLAVGPEPIVSSIPVPAKRFAVPTSASVIEFVIFILAAIAPPPAAKLSTPSVKFGTSTLMLVAFNLEITADPLPTKLILLRAPLPFVSLNVAPVDPPDENASAVVVTFCPEMLIVPGLVLVIVVLVPGINLTVFVTSLDPTNTRFAPVSGDVGTVALNA